MFYTTYDNVLKKFKIILSFDFAIVFHLKAILLFVVTYVKKYKFKEYTISLDDSVFFI